MHVAALEFATSHKFYIVGQSCRSQTSTYINTYFRSANLVPDDDPLLNETCTNYW